MKEQNGLFILCLLISVIVAGCAVAIPTPTAWPTATSVRPTGTAVPATAMLPTATPGATMPAVEPRANRKTYSNPAFGVSLQYPSAWLPKAGYERRFAGEDGFFQVDAISGDGLTIDEVADNDAYHKLQPYGSQPTIEMLQVQGLEARLILPSLDQRKEMENQAGLIIQLAQPIEVAGQKYNYLVIWADKNHIREIAKTIKIG